MQKIFLLSAYEISAADFFQKLQREQTDLLLDVRLGNTSQLCGFTKRRDLAFFVPQLTGAEYIHDLDFAPDKKLLDLYTKHHMPWEDYAREYQKLIHQRNSIARFHERYGDYPTVCLLGTGTKKRRSHNEVLKKLLLSQ
ncbi:MAG: DUF488 domain-containing protein [Selenomonas sp.]|uniref:DUF488 domain-containing protein n=1 Tax=Selenomonas sp. TaxID=2053611 RepID=UPI0025FE89A5|nr:DUF488 domain-containing protein [Selenomonas sp.]MCR5757281.1 DUF488 domain-containing protein [Selenomonas sp.]